MQKTILAAALIGGTIAPATAQSPIEGYWAGAGISCDAQNTDAVPLHISGNRIAFYESSCELTAPENIRGIYGQLFDVLCSGEGEQWSYRGLFILNEDGTMVYHRDGRTDIYNRCE